MAESRVILKTEYVDIISALYTKIKTKAKDLLDQGINQDNMILLTDMVMREVGKIKNLVGFEKKALVLATMRKFVDDRAMELHQSTTKLTEEMITELEDLKDLVEEKLGGFIDQIYTLAPDVYGKTKKRFFSFLSCFSA